MRYALIADGVVKNIVEVDPRSLDLADGEHIRIPLEGNDNAAELVTPFSVPKGMTGIADPPPEAVAGATYDGKTFTPPPKPVPQSVTNFQARAMLRANGIFDAVAAAIDAIPDDTERMIAQEALERAEFSRNSPLLVGVAKQLGKSDADIDEMFRQAAQIKV